MTPDNQALLYMIFFAVVAAGILYCAITHGPRLAKHTTRLLSALALAFAIAATLPIWGSAAIATSAGVAGFGFISYAVGYNRHHSPHIQGQQTNKRNT